jgi:hypothetical protein
MFMIVESYFPQDAEAYDGLKHDKTDVAPNGWKYVIGKGDSIEKNEKVFS